VLTKFSVISVHAQRSNANMVNGATLSQSRVGRTVWLSIYYRVASAPANSQATATFLVRRGKTLVDTQNIGLSLSGALPHTFQALDLYKLEESGMYTIAGRIAINGTSHTATVRLSVKT
jgi:hypothetical protein